MEDRKDDANLKSWILLLFGLTGIGYQQWTGEVNWLLLLVFSTMAGIPGVAQLLLLIRDSSTELQSSSSRQQRLEQGLEQGLDSSSQPFLEDNNG